MFCALPDITSSCTLFGNLQTILKSSSGGIRSDKQLVVTSHIEFFSTRVETNGNSQSKHHKLKYFNYKVVPLGGRGLHFIISVRVIDV